MAGGLCGPWTRRFALAVSNHTGSGSPAAHAPTPDQEVRTTYRHVVLCRRSLLIPNKWRRGAKERFSLFGFRYALSLEVFGAGNSFNCCSSAREQTFYSLADRLVSIIVKLIFSMAQIFLNIKYI